MNPGVKKLVPRNEFEYTMELLARGRFTDGATLISQNFALGLYQMLAAANCLSKDKKTLGEITFTRVKKRLQSDAIHLEYLN